MAAREFTLASVKDFMINNGGRVKNHQLVTHFKTFLNDQSHKGNSFWKTHPIQTYVGARYRSSPAVKTSSVHKLKLTILDRDPSNIVHRTCNIEVHVVDRAQDCQCITLRWHRLLYQYLSLKLVSVAIFHWHIFVVYRVRNNDRSTYFWRSTENTTINI